MKCYTKFFSASCNFFLNFFVHSSWPQHLTSVFHCKMFRSYFKASLCVASKRPDLAFYSDEIKSFILFSGKRQNTFQGNFVSCPCVKEFSLWNVLYFLTRNDHVCWVWHKYWLVFKEHPSVDWHASFWSYVCCCCLWCFKDKMCRPSQLS